MTVSDEWISYMSLLAVLKTLIVDTACNELGEIFIFILDVFCYNGLAKWTVHWTADCPVTLPVSTTSIRSISFLPTL